MNTLSGELDTQTLHAATSLLLLRHHSPPSDPHSPPSDLPLWGTRSRRSTSKQDIEYFHCTRPSPATPLDYVGGNCFDQSTSGSDGFQTSPEIRPVNKRLRVGDVAGPCAAVVRSKVGALERLPLVEAAVTTSKTIRRRGKKKTISELQAQERTLTEENLLLLKMLDALREDMGILMAENQRLETEAASLQIQMLPEEALKPAFFLPDLNEPVLVEANYPDT